jgi:hypothetical protein
MTRDPEGGLVPPIRDVGPMPRDKLLVKAGAVVVT